MEKNIKVAIFCFIAMFLLVLLTLVIDGVDKGKFRSTSLNTNTEYRDLCDKNDFESAHKVLNSLYKAYIEETKEEIKKTNKQAYHDALDYIFNKEALYLFSLEDETANKRITYLLTEIPVEGSCPSDGTEYSDLDADEFKIFGTTQEKDWGKYYRFVADYNAKCDQLLDLAIANDKKEIAKKLVAMIKDDIEIIKLDNSDLVYSSSDKSKTKAKAKYKEAFGD